MKYDKAIELIQFELVKVGGEIFTRYWCSKNKETAKHVEASEFIENMLNGKLVIDKENEFLNPYLERFYNLNSAIYLLIKYNK